MLVDAMIPDLGKDYDALQSATEKLSAEIDDKLKENIPLKRLLENIGWAPPEFQKKFREPTLLKIIRQMPIWMPGDEKWLRNFGRWDKWIVCLTAGTVVPANQEHS